MYVRIYLNITYRRTTHLADDIAGELLLLAELALAVAGLGLGGNLGGGETLLGVRGLLETDGDVSGSHCDLYAKDTGMEGWPLANRSEFGKSVALMPYPYYDSILIIIIIACRKVRTPIDAHACMDIRITAILLSYTPFHSLFYHRHHFPCRRCAYDKRPMALPCNINVICPHHHSVCA